MGDVVELDAQRPHFLLLGMDGRSHVVTEKLLLRVVSGELPVESLDPAYLRTILGEWVFMKTGRCDYG